MQEKIKLIHYDAYIQWEGNAYDTINRGILHLPDGTVAHVRRESSPSHYNATGGYVSMGQDKFVISQPDGDKTFDSFELMMESLGLKKEIRKLL